MYNLISSLGDNLHDFFHGILLIPKATVTSAKIRSSQMLSKPISAGWPKIHNFLDLGRNSIPIQLQLDTIPCHSYSHRLSNFGIPKFQIKKVFFSKDSHLCITLWLLSLENEHGHTFKPPWPNFTSTGILIHFSDRAAEFSIMIFRIKRIIFVTLSHFGFPFLIYSLETYLIHALKPPWMSNLSPEASPQFSNRFAILGIQIFRIQKVPFSKASHSYITAPFYILEIYHNYIVEPSWSNMPSYGASFHLGYRGNSHSHQNFQHSALLTFNHDRLHSHGPYSHLSIRCLCHHDTCLIIFWQMAYPDLPSRPQLQHNIGTTRTCLADTGQQLGVEISYYINEE